MNLLDNMQKKLHIATYPEQATMYIATNVINRQWGLFSTTNIHET